MYLLLNSARPSAPPHVEGTLVSDSGLKTLTKKKRWSERERERGGGAGYVGCAIETRPVRREEERHIGPSGKVWNTGVVVVSGSVVGPVGPVYENGYSRVTWYT